MRELNSQRSVSEKSTTLLIIDGDVLKRQNKSYKISIDSMGHNTF
jgi:hypothetical protein